MSEKEPEARAVTVTVTPVASIAGKVVTIPQRQKPFDEKEVAAAVAKVDDAVDDIGKILSGSIAKQRQREKDRLALRGEFAPPTGVCSCGGTTVPDIVFDWDGRMGGGPIPGRVKNWYCEACGLVYRFPSKGGKPVISKRPNKG